MTKAQEKKGAVETIELDIRDGSSTDDVSNIIEPEHSSTGMSKATWLACIALGMSLTTAIQQQASTASIVKHIDAALGPTTYYNWMISGHSITTALVLPLAGGISDLIGRRYFFIIGCLFSLIGVSVALGARDVPTMIAAMVLKGFGSGCQQLSLPAIGEIVPKKHRGTAQAVLDLVGLPWTVFGAEIGNSMVKHYKLSFRINFIIGILLNLTTIALIWFFYHPPAGHLPPGKSLSSALLGLDWIGIAFLAASITLTLVPLSLGGSLFPWKSAIVVGLLAMGAVSIISLLVWEWKFARNAFFSRELFQGKNNRFGLLLLLSLVGGMSLYASMAFWTQQAQGMFFSDPDKIGFSALPNGFGFVIGGFTAAMLLGKGGFFKANLMLVYGGLLKLTGDIMFVFVTPDRLILALSAGFIGSFGIGGLILGVIVCTQLTCMDEHIGLATLVMGSIRSIGGALAVTLYGNILQTVLRGDAGPRVAKAVIGMGIPKESMPGFMKAILGAKPQAAAKLPGVTREAIALASETVKWSYGLAFQRIYYCSIAFTIMSIMVGFFIKDVRENMTDTVAVKLQNDIEKPQSKV